MAMCPRCNSDAVVMEKSVSETTNKNVVKRYFYRCLICNMGFGDKA